MALFLDTSAVVKLFIQEPGSDAVHATVAGDSDVCIAWLTPHEFLIG